MTLLYETDRLVARRLEAADVDAMHHVYGDADAMRFVGDGVPLDRPTCERWFDVTQHNYLTRGYGMAALVERATGEIVGFCGIVHPGGQLEPEIKYALRRSVWGRGLATEAARGMLTYGHRILGLSTIIATVDAEHTASHHVLRKAGMRESEPRREADGSLTPTYVSTAPTEPGGS